MQCNYFLSFPRQNWLDKGLGNLVIILVPIASTFEWLLLPLIHLFPSRNLALNPCFKDIWRTSITINERRKSRNLHVQFFSFLKRDRRSKPNFPIAAYFQSRWGVSISDLQEDPVPTNVQVFSRQKFDSFQVEICGILVGWFQADFEVVQLVQPEGQCVLIKVRPI